jgi:hypothetical protein
VTGTKPAGPNDDARLHSKFISRGYSARYDFFDEHLLARAGFFLPKFGLMTADHTTYTRISAGFTPESEQAQIELTLQDDDFEATAAVLFAKEGPNRENRPKKGFNLALARMINQRNRLIFGFLKTEDIRTNIKSDTTSFSVAAVLTFTSKLFSMMEVSRVTEKLITERNKTVTDSAALFSNLNYEIMRGFSLFLRYELWKTELADNKKNKARYGGGINWYPRPHLQTELRRLHTKSETNGNQTIESTDLILHYYF